MLADFRLTSLEGWAFIGRKMQTEALSSVVAAMNCGRRRESNSSQSHLSRCQICRPSGLLAHSDTKDDRDLLAGLGRATAKGQLIAYTNPDAAVCVLKEQIPEEFTDERQAGHRLIRSFRSRWHLRTAGSTRLASSTPRVETPTSRSSSREMSSQRTSTCRSTSSMISSRT